jgi:heme iron utilization protein
MQEVEARRDQDGAAVAGRAKVAPFDALVHEPVDAGVDPLQVRRVTLRGDVRPLAEHDAARAADRAVYLARFPEAEPITALGDFAFFRLEITGGRLVSGFGGAVNLTARTLPSLLAVSMPS